MVTEVKANESDFDDFSTKNEAFETSTNDEFAKHATAFQAAQAADDKWTAKAEDNFHSFQADYMKQVK